MIKVLAILSCFALATLTAVAQGVTVQLALDQEQFLPGESLIVKVRITNDSGRDLQLGKDDGWLDFAVEDAQHFVVSRKETLPVRGEFTLAPSTIGTKKVELSSCFDLTRIGRYFVTATVVLPQWHQAIQSKAITFDIVKGNDLWEKDFGVPAALEPSETVPEIRRYALVEALRSNRPRLYFRLTDARETKVYKVFPLGTTVSFGNVEPQLDQFSNLHVLFQTGSKSFMHCLINPEGVQIARETYEYSDTRPVLRAQADGRITVAGGFRRFSASDLPPPPDSTSVTSDAKSAQP